MLISIIHYPEYFTLHTLVEYKLLNNKQAILYGVFVWLKEYYEIVDEARPLSGFVPMHADLFTEMHF